MICREDAQWGSVQGGRDSVQLMVKFSGKTLNHLAISQYMYMYMLTAKYVEPVLTCTGPPGLALSHMIEDVLHRATVRKVARAVVGGAIHLLLSLSPLALVSVEQENQLLLN